MNGPCCCPDSQGPTHGEFKQHVGKRTDFRILNNAESRVYAHGGRRYDGTNLRRMRKARRDYLPMVCPQSSQHTQLGCAHEAVLSHLLCPRRGGILP